MLRHIDIVTRLPTMGIEDDLSSYETIFSDDGTSVS